MEDLQIIKLFFDRSEEALMQVQSKYGAYCMSIADNVLSDRQDAQECLNDCLMRAWGTIPPQRPSNLKAYLGKIIRNLALDRLERRSAEKRGGGEVPAVLDELSEVVSGGTQPDQALIDKELTGAINEFLGQLDPVRRKVFVRRYWYMDSAADIAKMYGLNHASVRTMLARLRKELAEHLKKEGLDI